MMVRSAAASMLGLLLVASGAAAQLPQASAAILDRGYDPTASGGGFASIASNPAGLGRPDSPGFSLALPAVSAVAGVGPVTLRDLADWESTALPANVRDDWMAQIISAGSETGSVGVGITGLALSVGPVGFQLSTRAGGATDLSPDAAELLLYGNAGRTGEPRDFALEGSSVEGFVLSTAALSFGIEATAGLYLGLTGKYVFGNGLAVGRSGASFVTADPLAVELDFPMLYSDFEDYEFDQGTGIGLDLGAIWTAESMVFGVTIENVFNTFSWEPDRFLYVPGQAVFDVQDKESDFEEMPFTSAPQQLRQDFEAMADELTPETRIAIGASMDPASNLRVFGNVQKSVTDGLAFEPDYYVGLGTEWTGLSVLPLRAHVAVISEGFQLGGGASLVLGPVHLSGGAGLRSQSTHDSVVGTFTLSFGSH